VWLIILSDQLPIVALVSSYPTNELIGRRPILGRRSCEQLCSLCAERAHAVLSALSRRYSSPQGRLPTCYSPVRHSLWPKPQDVRLACVRHAASVYPEPGSNSPFKVSIICISHVRCECTKKMTETVSVVIFWLILCVLLSTLQLLKHPGSKILPTSLSP
jgi:hypothetical protein